MLKNNSIYIYIYIYVCVCVCVCVFYSINFNTPKLYSQKNIFCTLPFSWMPHKTNWRNLHLQTSCMLSCTNCTDWARRFKSPKKIRQKNLHENLYRSRPQPVAFTLTSEDSIYTRKSQTSDTGYRISAFACRSQYNILSRSVCYLYRLLHQSINENNPRYFFSFSLSSLHNYLINLSHFYSSSMLFNHLVLACH